MNDVPLQSGPSTVSFEALELCDSQWDIQEVQNETRQTTQDSVTLRDMLETENDVPA